MLIGQSFIELFQYSQAIEVLSELIEKNPTNKEAYFHRSIAYFETGNFESALKDYLESDKGQGIIKTSNYSKEFRKALIKAVCNGAAEGVVEFVPSMCSTIYGLGKTMWASAEHPIDSTKVFAGACYDIGECIVEFCKNADKETLGGNVDQVKTLYGQFDQLNDEEKGELIGYTVGKFGVDFFAGGVILKSVAAYQKLKNANRVCNMEAMLLSKVNKGKIIESSMNHAAERNAYFKNAKLNWDQQNKHIPGKHNYQAGKGTILIEEKEFEVLVKEYAGTGHRVTGPMFEAGYKERVDFKKTIGNYFKEIKGQPTEYIPTTKGIHHYDKKGNFHVVPSKPSSMMD